MKDGSRYEVSAAYEGYERAQSDLCNFNPSGEGVDDMENVAYATIEKRFSSTPIF